MARKSHNLERENAIQAACHGLLVRSAPTDCLFHSMVNEHKCSRARGAALNRMGRRAGVADYVVLFLGMTVYIEFKCPKDAHGPKTYQSKDQKEFEQDVIRMTNVHYFVVRSTAEFIGTMKAFGLLLSVRAV